MIRITVVRITEYRDLMEKYELPLECPCTLKEGMVFISENGEMPEGMCATAWETLAPFVKTLAEGGSRIYGDWMKDPRSAMVSCNDGFRPVSFYVEAVGDRVRGTSDSP